jgi:hypothetical protein
MSYTATYSPEDNKLRLYSAARLDSETYARVKAAGFIWAPKQDLFVAPMWTRMELTFQLAIIMKLRWRAYGRSGLTL